MIHMTQGMKEMKKKERETPMMNESTREWDSRIFEGEDSLPWRGKQSFHLDPSLKIPVVFFSLKWKFIEKLSNEHALPMLCDIARVSLSGYYAFKKRKKDKRTGEDRETKDLHIIMKIVDQGRRKYRYRTVTMKLSQDRLQWDNGWYMNHKKVLRLMRKYDLLAKIRRKNPYKQIQKATQEHNTAPNFVNREFQGHTSNGDTSRIMTPYKILGTDITYLRLYNHWTYLSLIKDMITGEALAWKLSSHLWLDGVQQTLGQLQERTQTDEIFRKQLKWAYIHSDQWFHYTHPSFGMKIKELWCIQSMSRRWNCLDNAPTESFFGHMKDELDLKSCRTFEELEKHIEIYIQYYNNERPQWTKKKMTPVEYRNHLLEQQSKEQQSKEQQKQI